MDGFDWDDWDAWEEDEFVPCVLLLIGGADGNLQAEPDDDTCRDPVAVDDDDGILPRVPADLCLCGRESSYWR